MTGKEYNEQFSETELKNEIWKDIPRWEGIYQVSNLGRVKSIDHLVILKDGRKRTFKEMIKKPTIYNYGVSSVILSINEKTYTVTIHRLVLLTFVGPCPEGMECCHNDGNASNNRLENLRWDTHLNNEKDKIKHGTRLRGEKVANAKLTTDMVYNIRLLYTYMSCYEINKIYPFVGRKHINDIVNYKKRILV